MSTPTDIPPYVGRSSSSRPTSRLIRPSSFTKRTRVYSPDRQFERGSASDLFISPRWQSVYLPATTIRRVRSGLPSSPSPREDNRPEFFLANPPSWVKNSRSTVVDLKPGGNAPREPIRPFLDRSDRLIPGDLERNTRPISTVRQGIEYKVVEEGKDFDFTLFKPDYIPTERGPHKIKPEHIDWMYQLAPDEFKVGNVHYAFVPAEEESNQPDHYKYLANQESREDLTRSLAARRRSWTASSWDISRVPAVSESRPSTGQSGSNSPTSLRIPMRSASPAPSGFVYSPVSPRMSLHGSSLHLEGPTQASSRSALSLVPSNTMASSRHALDRPDRNWNESSTIGEKKSPSMRSRRRVALHKILKKLSFYSSSKSSKENLLAMKSEKDMRTLSSSVLQSPIEEESVESKFMQDISGKQAYATDVHFLEDPTNMASNQWLPLSQFQIPVEEDENAIAPDGDTGVVPTLRPAPLPRRRASMHSANSFSARKSRASLQQFDLTRSNSTRSTTGLFG